MRIFFCFKKIVNFNKLDFVMQLTYFHAQSLMILKEIEKNHRL